VRWTGFDPAPARPYAPEAFAALPQDRILSAGDILWNSTGTGTVGRSTVLPKLGDFGKMAADSHVTVIRTFPEVLPRFVDVFISSPHIQQNMDDLTSGTTKQQELNLGTILELPLPIPPLAEQERIIARLDEVLPLIDQLAELEREREHLDRGFAKAIERAILQAAISGKLTKQLPEDGTAAELLGTIKTERQQLEKEGKIKKQKTLPPLSDEVDLFDIPSCWAWVRLGHLVKYSGSGSTPKGGKAVYVHEGTMFLRSQNIHNEGLRTQDVAFVSQETVETLGANTVYTGDLLLNITGASIGRAAVFPSGLAPSKTNQHILTIRLMDLRIARYIQTVVTSDYGFRQIMQRQNGGTKEGLNSTSALSLPIPVPPVAEQERIAAKLDRALPLTRGLRELVS
jgi:type I restriction enzyme S subunit